MFGSLQLKRIDWRQEMFKEDEELERKREQCTLGPDWDTVRGQSSGKAPRSRQPLHMNDEGNETAVDTTEVTKENESEKEWEVKH